MGNPIFKILNGPSPLSAGGSEAILSGLSPVFSAISKAADLLPHDLEGLLQVLHFRIHTAESAQKRENWFFGRLYNKYSGNDPGYIPLSGSHLHQTLGVVGIQTPDFVAASGEYALRVDLAKEAHSILSAAVKQRQVQESDK